MAIKQYNARFGETVIDVVSKTLKNLDNVYSFIVQNNLNSIEEVLAVGVALNYDTSLIKFKDTNLGLVQTVISDFKTFKTLDNQSVYDLCLNKCGNLDELANFIVENNFDGINDDDCKLKNVVVSNSKFDNKYSKKNFVTLYIPDKTVIEEEFLILNTGDYILQTNNYKIKING